MLLGYKDMAFLSEVVIKDNQGRHYARKGLTKEQKEKLLGIDEMFFITEHEHYLVNYHELENELRCE